MIFYFAFKWAGACHHGFYGQLFREFTDDLQEEQRHLGGDEPSGKDEVICFLGYGFHRVGRQRDSHHFDFFWVDPMIDEVLPAVGSDHDVAVKASENKETEHFSKRGKPGIGVSPRVGEVDSLSPGDNRPRERREHREGCAVDYHCFGPGAEEVLHQQQRDAEASGRNFFCAEKGVRMIEPAGAPIMSRDEWIGIDRPEAGTNSLCHLIDEGDAVREREVGDQDNFLQLEPLMGVFKPLFIISRSEINILAVNKKDFRDPER